MESGFSLNPKQYFFPETKLPLVGIKLYQGDAYFYDATLMKMIAELMSALSAFPCNVHMLTAAARPSKSSTSTSPLAYRRPRHRFGRTGADRIRRKPDAGRQHRLSLPGNG